MVFVEKFKALLATAYIPANIACLRNFYIVNVVQVATST